MDTTSPNAVSESGSRFFSGAHSFSIGQQYSIGQLTTVIPQYSGGSGLLDLLRPVGDASHIRNRRNSPPNSICQPGTRENVIQNIASWVDGGPELEQHLLWLYGHVGCGKSAIAQVIADRFANRKRLAGSFFFFRGSGSRSRAIGLVATLAAQLAAAIPATAPLIRRALESQAGLLTCCSLELQFQFLILEPFQQAASALTLGTFLIVLDGLDECDDREDVTALIDHLITFFDNNPDIPLRIFISSRVEEHIQSRLETPQVHLIDLIDHTPDGDIALVVQETFKRASKHDRVIKAYGEWPTPEDLQSLVKNAGGSFIFISMLLKFILTKTNDGRTPMDRLAEAMDIKLGLDDLYTETLSRSQHVPHFSSVLSTLALLCEPLSIHQLTVFLGIKPYEVVHVLTDLQSIVQVPGDDHRKVTFFHTSLRDFLVTEPRAGRFFASPAHHKFLALRCFELKSDGDARHKGNRRCFHCEFADTAYHYASSHQGDHWDRFFELPCSRINPQQLKLDAREIMAVLKATHSTSLRCILATSQILDRHLLSQIAHRWPERNYTLGFITAWLLPTVTDWHTVRVVTVVLDRMIQSWGASLDVYAEFEAIRQELHTPPAPNLLSYHSYLNLGCIAILFHRWSGPGGMPVGFRDQGDDAAMLYAFVCWGYHLTEAIRSGTLDVKILLSDQGGSDLLYDAYYPKQLERDLKPRSAAIDFATVLLDPAQDHFADILQLLKRNIELGRLAVDELIKEMGGRPELEPVSISSDDWKWVCMDTDAEGKELGRLGCIRDDTSMLNLWTGYMKISRCYISIWEGTHPHDGELSL